MKMADVKTVFEKAGMRKVITVLASGNVIFESEKTASELRIILEKAMSDYFNYEAFLFIKSEAKMRQMFEDIPFVKDPNEHI